MKLEHTQGKATALTVLAHKLGRAVYDLRTREQVFDLTRFVTAYPLRGEIEPAVSLATSGLPFLDGSSVSTAPTVQDHLSTSPRAAWRDWTISPAHLLGDASARVPWLPLHRV